MKKMVATALTGSLLLGAAAVQAKEVTRWYEDETISFPEYEPSYFKGKIDVVGTEQIEAGGIIDENHRDDFTFSGDHEAVELQGEVNDYLPDDLTNTPHARMAATKKKVVYGDSYKGFTGVKNIDIKGMYVTWDDGTKRLLRIEVVFNSFQRDYFESLFLNTDYNPSIPDDWETWDYFVNTDCYGRNDITDGAGSVGPNRDNVENDYKVEGSSPWYGGAVPAEGVYKVKSEFVNPSDRLTRYTFADDRGLETSDYSALTVDALNNIGRLHHPNGMKTFAMKEIMPVPDYYYYAKKFDNATGQEILQPEEGRVYRNMSIIYDFTYDQSAMRFQDVHDVADIYPPLDIYLSDHFMIGFTTSSAYDVMLLSGTTVPEEDLK